MSRAQPNQTAPPSAAARHPILRSPRVGSARRSPVPAPLTRSFEPAPRRSIQAGLWTRRSATDLLIPTAGGAVRIPWIACEALPAPAENELGAAQPLGHSAIDRDGAANSCRPPPHGRANGEYVACARPAPHWIRPAIGLLPGARPSPPPAAS